MTKDKKIIGKKFITFEIILAIVLVVGDLLTKLLIDINYDLFESRVIIPNILNFTYVHNAGASFSMLEGQQTLFYIITPIAFIGFTYYFVSHHQENRWANVAIVMILSGIVGNFYDRIKFQYVRDFIEIKFIKFPIWNVADMALVVGTIIFVIYLLSTIKEEMAKEKEKKENE